MYIIIQIYFNIRNSQVYIKLEFVTAIWICILMRKLN